jgi:hypothetical protein
MTRIFLSLSIAATGTLLVALWLGLNIGDAAEVTTAAQNRVATHFLTALGALMFAVLVHAIVLTYFMGTSRWLEETSNAYRLGSGWQQQSKDLKWKLYPAMVVALTMLILTGAFGGAADPASGVGFRGWGPFSAAHIHLGFAVLTVLVNAMVNAWEYAALRRNGRLVQDVLQQVRRIRTERGLDV